MALLSAQALVIAHPSQPLGYVFDFSFADRGFICLLGRNGSGKSTLLKTLTGDLSPHSGRLCWLGQQVEQYPRPQLAKMLALVYPQRLEIPYLTVFDLVMYGRYPHQNWWAKPRGEDHERVEAVLAELELLPLARRELRHCSDGEQQLAMLARALAQDTPALILDEATAQLDYYNRERIFAILQKLASQKLIIFATHEVALALQYSEQVLYLQAPSHWQLLPSPQAKDLFR